MLWNLFKKTASRQSNDSDRVFGHKRQPIQLPFSELSKRIPIGELPAAELSHLPVFCRHFAAGEIVFQRGDIADELIYLHQGEVFLEDDQGNGYQVADSVFKACYPLSGQHIQHFTAIAKTSAQVLYIPITALQRSSRAAEQRNPLKSENLPTSLTDSLLFRTLNRAYRNDQLQVPSLPDVALRLRRALQQDIDVSDAARIINLDAQITAKLIEVANSPLYQAAQPIVSSHDAILRLGFKTTQNLVTGISLHHLFRNRNARLNSLTQQLWKQSIHVASLSHTLADLSGTINPDEALLGGLVHNIGALPIIALAESLPSEAYTEQQLLQTLSVLQAQVGQYLLQKWHFPEALQRIPTQTNHWYHDSSATLQLSDIVLLARFHHTLTQPQQAARLPPLPTLPTLPAFRKWGKNHLSPDLSLQILSDAKQQIHEALNLFKL